MGRHAAPAAGGFGGAIAAQADLHLLAHAHRGGRVSHVLRDRGDLARPGLEWRRLRPWPWSSDRGRHSARARRRVVSSLLLRGRTVPLGAQCHAASGVPTADRGLGRHRARPTRFDHLPPGGVAARNQRSRRGSHHRSAPGQGRIEPGRQRLAAASNHHPAELGPLPAGGAAARDRSRHDRRGGRRNLRFERGGRPVAARRRSSPWSTA